VTGSVEMSESSKEDAIHVNLQDASRETTASTPTDASSLRERAVVGATWVVVGTGARQMLRLGSSLVLTRILFPEAFGLVATASLLSAAVEMCSDLGIQQAVVQHRDGGKRRYLDSGWTMAAVRGLVLAGGMAAFARPFASFFGQPTLAPIVLVISLGAILRGLTSPSIMLLDRNLELGRLMAWEVCSDVIRIAITIGASLLLESVWGLVIGGLIGEFVRLVGSYVVARYVPRLCWDRQAMGELFRYGRFILISSLIGYGATRLDSVFVAKFLGMEKAGVYYIATTLAMMFGELFTRMAGRVLFPAFSRRQDDAPALRQATVEVMRLVAIVILPVCTVMAVNAGLILAVLYDSRYAEAAIAFRWLCAAACVTLLGNILNAPLMATGRPHFATIGSATKLLLLCLATPLLGRAYGVEGYAGAMAIAACGFVAVVLVACSRHGHISFIRFLQVLIGPLALCVVIAWIHHAVGRGMTDAARACTLIAVDVVVLAAFWVWRWEHLRSFVPHIRWRASIKAGRSC